jgi:hypothetical protein
MILLTLAVLTPDKGMVVSALTFVECCKEPCNITIILFLATNPSFMCVGMASLLLDLVFHDLRTPYNGCNSVVLLKVNKKDNPNAYYWYECQGFNKVGGRPSFPAELSSAFAKEDVLAHYLNFAHENPCLQWVRKVLKSSCSLPESTVVRTLRYEQFFTNPFSTTDPSAVYAIFAGNLTFQQSDLCVDDSKHLSHDVFIAEGPLDPNLRITLPWGLKAAHAPWVNQCFQTGSQAHDDTMMDLVLTYARTTCQLTNLVEHDNTAFLVTEMAGMQQLYYQSREVGVDPSEYDPVVDNKLFMRKATPVMHFIFANKDLFKKAFIAFFPQDE